MHSFDRRLAALENSGASAACELICVELALDAQGRQRGEPVWAEWRESRFERLPD